ncbi:hypothetical protein E4U13_003534 [Claviceps humidiphila]|uniref:Uncharacterized protein n=1 Tax=Claviceps humidiphila TaxID=1294629 RepID=A0A9P7TPQ7_9HYPO|nr:hypothetical protein E4U13_003534 [Claviceps humidiphila]
MAASEELQPPPEMNMADPGAHQLTEPESSDSEDQFTDAQSNPMTPRHFATQIPKTRVEKVDSNPSHGEVPGTEAHRQREADAQPDEIAVLDHTEDHLEEASTPIPKTRVEKIDSIPSHGEVPGTEAHKQREADAQPDEIAVLGDIEEHLEEASTPIPITRVEKVDSNPSYGEVPGTEAYRQREADAQPDEIAVLDDFTKEHLEEASMDTPRQDVPITVLEPVQSDHGESSASTRSSDVDAKPDIVLEAVSDCAENDYEDEKTVKGCEEQENNCEETANDCEEAAEDCEETTNDCEETMNDFEATSNGAEEINDEEEEQVDDFGDNFSDDFGDDFDDFEEGAHDAEFDDFEDGFQQAQPSPAVSRGPQPVLLSQLPFPIPDFDGLAPDEVLSATEQCLNSLFPPEELDLPAPETLPKESSLFLTPRSASLWSQLVAPPPLAPPDWIRSRTRRLFLVSLGVPVDLDEILPASKQKKLILPSLHLRATSPGSGGRSRSTSRVRRDSRNASSTSLDAQGKPTSSGLKKRKGPPPAPELDLVAARYLCTTTDEALGGMTNEELQKHVEQLEAMQGTAQAVLEYWQRRADERIGDREAFEGVIENLVKHARKFRK